MSSDPTIRVLSDGTKIPVIAYGTGTALYNRPAADAVHLAIKSGVTHIDEAEVYANEDSAGDALSEIFKTQPRSSVFITTKLNVIPPGGTVRDALTESLKKLKVDYVDLYLIHSPVKLVGHLKEVWKQFEELKAEGLALSIGVSNFRIKDFEEFVEGAKVKPTVNQIELHPYVYKHTIPLLEYQKKYGIVTASYGGLVPLTRRPDGPVTAVVKSIQSQLASATGKKVTEGQVLSKWLEAKDALIVTTSSKESRIKETLSIFDLPSLTAEQVEAIDAAGSQLHLRIFGKHMDDI